MSEMKDGLPLLRLMFHQFKTLLFSDRKHSLLEEHKKAICVGQGVGHEAHPLSVVSNAAHYVEELMTHGPTTTLQYGSTSTHNDTHATSHSLSELGSEVVLMLSDASPPPDEGLLSTRNAPSLSISNSLQTEARIPDMSYNPAVPPSAPAQIGRRKRRRNRAEMVAAASNSMIPEPPLSAKRQRKRTRAEITAAASSSGAIVAQRGSSGLTPRRPRKTRARVYVFAVSSGTAAVTADSTLPVPHKPRRTHAQLAAVSSLGTALTTATSGRNVTHGRVCAPAEPSASANTPALPGPVLLTPGTIATSTRKQGHIPTEKHITADIPSKNSHPRAGSAPDVPRRPRRTQIEMAIDAIAPALYKRQAARIPKVRTHVCKGLGCN